ncbi:transcriptional regulator, GntR family [Ruminiclostridium papyrosolvens DSM 2782]|uniref:Transcriptional regulator, GntR family n=1 Tax=Ruminiclostridium papyrosolvens DSM 2782 TaxID=588581 RepID=F1TBF2_9FIRM|nr:GntR family transcriptional regulator [Ruminiclostridium papyrosolvens]EGD48356.1 transcriptional regulator, GntR family [Ruminiclostridium papyrosolvens DSM 2782]WES34140.1 GntR family transcriptional regulator [Ruminiclostridium papyrosolvens DSM 2782]
MNRFQRNVLPLKEVIYMEVKNKILNLEYKPGQMISETEISELLNVSRTPVREVFIRLSYEKLIDIYPQKGTFVSLVDLSYVKESVYMRNLLECQIAGEIIDIGMKDLPAEIKKNIRLQKDLVENEGNIEEFLELDNDFHKVIFKAVNHETIWDIISTTRIHYNRFRLLTMYEPEMLKRVFQEHFDIMTKIEEGDKAGCNALLKKHHYNGLEHADVLKEKYPGYFL